MLIFESREEVRNWADCSPLCSRDWGRRSQGGSEGSSSGKKSRLSCWGLYKEKKKEKTENQPGLRKCPGRAAEIPCLELLAAAPGWPASSQGGGTIQGLCSGSKSLPLLIVFNVDQCLHRPVPLLNVCNSNFHLLKVMLILFLHFLLISKFLRNF